MKLPRTLVLVLALGLVAAACSDDDSTDPPTAADDSVATDGSTPDDPPDDGGSTADGFGVPSIEILTPASGGGERPMLEWAAVEGAEEYNVVALTTDGEPYWAWVGQTSSVVFGGGDPAGDAGQLAVVYGPLTWTVAAFGPSGDLLALSQRAPLAP